MDYRYETKNEARDFHKQRKSFIIINGEVHYIPEGSAMSHFEYCQTKGNIILKIYIIIFYYIFSTTKSTTYIVFVFHILPLYSK